MQINELTHLDLFSGIGGFALAAKWNGFRTLAFCDNEPYAQAVLKKHWPDVPCHKDIREVRGDLYAGVTLLTGGFPCQPFSVAGKRRGKDDDRHLWPEMLRVIEEAQPAWVIGENVAGIINMELDKVCSDLETKGYEVQPLVVPACAVDAPHRRDRVWIIARCLANSKGNRTQGRVFEPREKRNESWENGNIVANSSRSGQGGHQRIGATGAEGLPSGYPPECCSYSGGENVANASTIYAQGFKKGQGKGEPWGGCRWLSEPDVGRVANGIPNRVHRLKGLGNAIVPQVAAEIIRCIRIVHEVAQSTKGAAK